MTHVLLCSFLSVSTAKGVYFPVILKIIQEGFFPLDTTKISKNLVKTYLKSKTGAKYFRDDKNHDSIYVCLCRIWYGSNSSKVRNVFLRYMTTLSTTNILYAKQQHVDSFFLSFFLSLTPSTQPL